MPRTHLARALANRLHQTLHVYWLLARIMVPVSICAEALRRLGVIEAVAPAFAPLMHGVGLPAEMGIAWLTGMLVGIWAAVPLIFTLVPAGSLSTAQITVLSALLLFAHGLPVEQNILRMAGPRIMVTTALRIGGGLIFAAILHQIFSRTGWLAAPASPAWVPMGGPQNWSAFLIDLAWTMAMMLVILAALTLGLDLLRAAGILDWLMRAFAPLLRLAGVGPEAAPLAAIGLLLGVSYGGGLMIAEARSGRVPPRQVFLCCVLMGFAHSVIEDTLIVVSLGADLWAVLGGRVAFAIAATALVATILRALPERTFRRLAFEAA